MSLVIFSHCTECILNLSCFKEDEVHDADWNTNSHFWKTLIASLCVQDEWEWSRERSVYFNHSLTVTKGKKWQRKCWSTCSNHPSSWVWGSHTRSEHVPHDFHLLKHMLAFKTVLNPAHTFSWAINWVLWTCHYTLALMGGRGGTWQM